MKKMETGGGETLGTKSGKDAFLFAFLMLMLTSLCKPALSGSLIKFINGRGVGKDYAR